MIKFDTAKLKPEHFKEAGFVTAAEIGPNNEHIFTYINDDYAEQLEQDNIDTDKIGAYATYEFISSHYNYEQDSQLFYIVPAPDCKDGPYTDFIAVLFDKGAIDVIIYEGLSLYKSMAAVLCDNSYNSVHTAETIVHLLDRVVAIAEGRKASTYFPISLTNTTATRITTKKVHSTSPYSCYFPALMVFPTLAKATLTPTRTKKMPSIS